MRTLPVAVPRVGNHLSAAQAMALADQWVSEKNRQQLSVSSDMIQMSESAGGPHELVNMAAFAINVLRRLVLRRTDRDSYGLTRAQLQQLRLAFDAAYASPATAALHDAQQRKTLGELLFTVGTSSV